MKPEAKQESHGLWMNKPLHFRAILYEHHVTDLNGKTIGKITKAVWRHNTGAGRSHTQGDMRFVHIEGTNGAQYWAKYTHGNNRQMIKKCVEQISHKRTVQEAREQRAKFRDSFHYGKRKQRPSSTGES
jgi:hypothetical protein